MEPQATPNILYTLCPYCGKKIKAGLKFCTGCGSSLLKKEAKTEHVCQKCGQAVKSTEKFCPNCGAPCLSEAAQTANGLQQDRICGKCGEKISPTSQFCSNCGAPCPAQAAQMEESVLSHEEFFQKNATRATKFWRSALPIVGFISCAIYLIIGLLCMITFTYPFNGILYLLDFLVVCGLSFAMIFTKKTVFYIILTAYMGVSLILAALDLDFSNIFWLCIGIYESVKLYKIDTQYKSYLRRGMRAYY